MSVQDRLNEVTRRQDSAQEKVDQQKKVVGNETRKRDEAQSKLDNESEKLRKLEHDLADVMNKRHDLEIEAERERLKAANDNRPPMSRAA